MIDPVKRAAMQRAVTASAELEVELMATRGTRPLLAVLAKARSRASDATVALSDVDPEDPKAIRKLQNEIKVFDLLIEWMTQIVAEGFEASDALSEEEIDDLAQSIGVTTEEAAEIRTNGIAPQIDA